MAFMRFRMYFSIINVIANCSILSQLNLHDLEMATHEGRPSTTIRPPCPVHPSNMTSRDNLPVIHQPIVTNRVSLSSDQPPPYEIAIKLVNPSNVAELRLIKPTNYVDTLDQTCGLFYRSSPENEEAQGSQKLSYSRSKFKKVFNKFTIIFTLLFIFFIGIYLFIFVSPIGGIILGVISVAVLVFYINIFICSY